jgi:hypothetical protein
MIMIGFKGRTHHLKRTGLTPPLTLGVERLRDVPVIFNRALVGWLSIEFLITGSNSPL